MRDFTVKIDKLPTSFTEYIDEISIKQALWDQITQLINDAKQAGICESSLDPTIVDIQFGRRNYDCLNDLKSLMDNCIRVEEQIIKLRSCSHNKQR